MQTPDTLFDRFRDLIPGRGPAYPGAVVLLCLLLFSSIPGARAADRLGAMEQDLIAESRITHIPASQLAASVAGQPDLVLFDIREADEYAVSHLQDAIRLDPSISGEAFLDQYGNQILGKQVVFYCSTGRRSTNLAERVSQVLQARNSSLPEPANLQGGIFRWHNNAMPLVNGSGSTDYVHPYNWWWKRLLEHRDLTSYEPVIPE